MLELLHTLVTMGTVIVIVFLVLLALPNCRLREFLMPFVKIGIVALCGAYVISPIDVMPELITGPFGFVDDLGVAIGGFLTFTSALDDFKRLGRSA